MSCIFCFHLTLPRALALALFCLLYLPYAASADKGAIKLRGGQIVIGEEQKLMLEASKHVRQRDYQAALDTYNRVLALNGANVQAYIQRSVVRREMQDAAGSQADAAAAVRLSEAALQQDNANPRLYYQRGTGYRLLKDFAKARENILYAIRLAGGQRADWESDLRAIDLEEKMNQ